MIFKILFFLILNFIASAQEEKVRKNRDNHTSSIAIYSEFLKVQYHNFNFLPDAYFFASGIHYHQDLICSGRNYAIGINPAFTFSHSAQIRKLFAYEASAFLYGRIGFIDKLDENSLICIKSGIGTTWFQGLENPYSLQASIRPSLFFELDFDLGRPIYFRYNKIFSSSEFTKEGYQVGVLFPL